MRSRFIFKNYLVLSLIVIFFSCDQKTNSETIQPKLLSNEQIILILEDFAVSPYGDNNFHFFYREYLNDSTWIVNIHQNEFLGGFKFGLCDVIDFKGHKVFIYGQSCNKKSNEDLIKYDGWPTGMDGISFNLLIEERNGHLVNYYLKKQFKFTDWDEQSDSLIDILK